MKNDTAWFGLLARPAFHGLAEYYEKSESLLQSARREAASRIDEEVKKMAKDSKLSDDQEYAEWSIKIQDHETTYDMLFTNFFRYSFIVLAYAVLEDHLDRLCVAFHDAKSLTEPPPAPRGNIVKTYRDYIDRGGALVQSDLWEPVQDLQSLRNCIAHSSGDVSRSRYQSQILKIVAKDIGILISRKSANDEMTPLYLRDNMVMVEPRYCTSIAPQMHVLIEAICKAVDLPTTMKFEGNTIILQ